MNESNGWARNGESEKSLSDVARNILPSESGKRGKRRLTKPRETEEEAIVRRFNDAQRMARFRANKRKEVEEAKAIEASRLSELALITELKRRNVAFQITKSTFPVQHTDDTRPPQRETTLATISLVKGRSKYTQLLSVIEELGRDIKLSYAGSRTSAERLKTGIVQARTLVRDCLLEMEINSRR